ncbi:hypothetical protein [Candidatus Poriferisodalis sp.]|uniref:hypothetical protein n=1 Tax=Candidatus Poriferisodalis sp. TaxID=3101277 RepID=UPI003B518720
MLVVGTISTASEVSVSTCSLDGVAASVVGAGWGTVVAAGGSVDAGMVDAGDCPAASASPRSDDSAIAAATTATTTAAPARLASTIFPPDQPPLLAAPDAEGRFDRFLRILSPAALACHGWPVITGFSRSGVASMIR